MRNRVSRHIKERLGQSYCSCPPPLTAADRYHTATCLASKMTCPLVRRVAFRPSFPLSRPSSELRLHGSVILSAMLLPFDSLP